MRQYDPAVPLISIHVPKCAGQSFAEILKTWFGAGYLRHYYNEKWNKPPVKYTLYRGIFRKRFKPGLCIHGHFNRNRRIGVEDYYPELNQYITILRDPFELHLSNYFFVKRLGGKAYRSGNQHPLAEKELSVSEYLKSSKQSYIREFLPADLTLDNYQQILGERFVFIGVAERLQQSVDRLAGILGYPSMLVPEKNISARAEDIPPGARDEFVRNNPLEMAIYKYALEKII